MSKLPSPCAFCRERRPLSKSHIWPEWAQKIVPATAPYCELTLGAKMETFEPTSKGPNFFQTKRPGSAAKRRPRNTCQVCNEGWMREIEELAKPTVTKLLLGQRTLLIQPLSQRRIAIRRLRRYSLERCVRTYSVPLRGRAFAATRGLPSFNSGPGEIFISIRATCCISTMLGFDSYTRRSPATDNRPPPRDSTGLSLGLIGDHPLISQVYIWEYVLIYYSARQFWCRRPR